MSSSDVGDTGPGVPFEKVVELIGGAQADVDNEYVHHAPPLVRLKNDPKGATTST